MIDLTLHYGTAAPTGWNQKCDLQSTLVSRVEGTYLCSFTPVNTGGFRVTPTVGGVRIGDGASYPMTVSSGRAWQMLPPASSIA